MPTIKTTDHGRSLDNPMMGWVRHHYDNGVVGQVEVFTVALDNRAVRLYR